MDNFAVWRTRIKHLLGFKSAELSTNRKHIAERLAEASGYCQLFVDLIERLGVDRGKAVAAHLDKLERNSPRVSPAVRTYNRIARDRALPRDIITREQTSFGAGLSAICERAIKFISSIENDLDAVFPNKIVAIENLTFGQVAILNAVRELRAMGTGLVSLVGHVQSEICADASPALSKWRDAETDRLPSLVPLMLFAYHNSQPGAAGRILDQLAKQNSNLAVITPDGQPNVEFLGEMDPQIKQMVDRGLMSCNIVRFFGEWWVIRRAQRMERLEYDKRAMESRIDLLSLQLAKQDSDTTAKAVQLRKSIEFYQAKVDIAARQIAEYRREGDDD